MPGFPAPARSLLLTLVLAVLLIPAVPAGAAEDGCAETWARLAQWTLTEEVEGLTAERLEALQAMVPRVDDCQEVSGGGMGDNAAGWAALVAVFFPADEVDRVVCLIEAESGGNPAARNPGSGASGLMQVMPGWAGVFGYEPQELFDPSVNLWIARRIRDTQGWGAWSPYLRGACR